MSSPGGFVRFTGPFTVIETFFTKRHFNVIARTVVNFRVRLYDGSQSGARFGRFGDLIVSTIAGLCFIPLFLRFIIVRYRGRYSRDRFVVNHSVFTMPVWVFLVFHVENLHFLFLLLLWRGRCLSGWGRQTDIRLFNDDFNDRLRFFDVNRFLHHLDERFMRDVDCIAASSAIYTIGLVLDGICIRGQTVSIE